MLSGGYFADDEATVWQGGLRWYYGRQKSIQGEDTSVQGRLECPGSWFVAVPGADSTRHTGQVGGVGSMHSPFK